jgi:hypothetical protein
LFSDDHDARRARPLAEDGLRAHLPEVAAATPRRRGAQLWKRWVGRNEISG